MKKVLTARPIIPELANYQLCVKDILESGFLTNEGPYLKAFEEELSEYLGQENLLLVSSATTGLMLALKSFDLPAAATIATSTYSFPATSQAIKFIGFTPLFFDVQEDCNISLTDLANGLNTDPSIDAIMPVECYGNPLDLLEIRKLLPTSEIPIILDSAHTFGPSWRNRSLKENEIAVLSLHATKGMNSIEGGVIICGSKEKKDALVKARNFGYTDTYEVEGFGINAKMSELHASFGLLALKACDDAIKTRYRNAKLLRATLDNDVKILLNTNELTNNLYFPVKFTSQRLRDQVHRCLTARGIFSRCYFNPLLHTIYRETNHLEFPKAANLASTVLCLPIHHDIDETDLMTVANLINGEIIKAREELSPFQKRNTHV